MQNKILEFELKYTDKGYILSDKGETIDYILEEIIDKDNSNPPFILSYNLYDMGNAFYNYDKFSTIELCEEIKMMFVMNSGVIVLMNKTKNKIIGYVNYTKDGLKITILKFGKVDF